MYICAYPTLIHNLQLVQPRARALSAAGPPLRPPSGAPMFASAARGQAPSTRTQKLVPSGND